MTDQFIILFFVNSEDYYSSKLQVSIVKLPLFIKSQINVWNPEILERIFLW